MEDQQHAAGGHYSGARPVPTISKFIESLDKDKKERDRKIDESQRAQKSKGTKSETRRRVHDPVTGKEVEIEDIDMNAQQVITNPQLTVPNANLSKDTPVKTDASQPLDEYHENQDVTAPPDPLHPDSTSDVPIHDEKTNVLFHPTPSISYEPAFASLETKGSVLCTAVFIAIVLLGRMFGASLIGLVPTAGCVAAGLFLWVKEVVRSGRELEWESEKMRGETATANLLPESVEWFNTLMGIFWGLINPEMFVTVADTLEDVMQASVPRVIEMVRVADINQGSNPPRILSLRALPDEHVKELKENIHAEMEKSKDPEQLAAEEEGGDYYNLEVSIAYHAAPTGKSVSARARNLHMQLVFYLGVRGLFGVPLPIWVELQSVVATARIRLQMSPEAPFLKALTFTLMGSPQVSAGCTPMMERGINILNLPIISNFVNYAIRAAASMYVAPKSMTIDLASILQGDTVQKETEAIGVIWVRIHKAVGLSKQDRRGRDGGGSDPYITLAFSKYEKIMYSTRVITDELNPVWEECAGLLVDPQVIKADEQLSVELWDSDRHTADDVVGKVELSIQKLIQHPRKMYPQVSSLRGMHAESSMPGQLHWEVGYFDKPSFRPALRTDGKNPNLPEHLKDKPEFQDEKGTISTPKSDAVAHTPPDPLWPSGICSVVIHQIVNLELENIQGSQGKRRGREYEPARDYGEMKHEEGDRLPTSYCTILFNDQLEYKTRVKAVTARPVFNAGTERFVRDWRSTLLAICVRDQRHREHDPILGTVSLKVSELLQSSSQVTRWYPLDGGIGFGRIRISVLWRAVTLKLPPSLLGWDVGTFQFTSPRILGLGYGKVAKLKMRTGGSSASKPRSSCQKLPEGDGVYWDATDLQLPVRYRYRSPILMEFHLSAKRHADAYAIFWLQDVPDDEVTPFNAPIYRTNDPHRLTQNFSTEETVHDLNSNVTEVGRLHFRGRFSPGFSKEHEMFIQSNDDRETYETWQACRAEGSRGSQITKELPETIHALHEKSLTEARDVLKEAPPEEKRRWLAKDGQDWSGAFGQDPADLVRSKNDRTPTDSDDPSSSDDDLGVQEASDDRTDNETMNGSVDRTSADEKPADNSKQSKDTLARRHRGVRQWKAAREAIFFRDEAMLGMKKVKHRMTGGLQGRDPKPETEA